MTRIWDGQKMADLVAQKAKLEKKFGAICDKLHQGYNTDGWQSDDSKAESYNVDQMRHAQLSREIHVVNSEIDTLDRFRPERIEARRDEPFTRFMQRGHNGLTSEEIKEFGQQSADPSNESIAEYGSNFECFVINKEDKVAPQDKIDRYNRFKMATASDASSGQELVPETVRPSVLDVLAYFGGVDKMAKGFMTSTGNEYRIPANDESTQKGEILGSQDTSVATKDLAAFTEVTFEARTGHSRRIDITREMLQDSIIDIAGFANARVVRRMGRSWDDAFTTGGTIPAEVNGAPASTNPTYPSGYIGVQKASKLGHTTAGSNKIAYGDVVELVYSVNRAYRTGNEGGEGALSAEQGGRVGFLIADSYEKAFRALVDSDGRPLWQPMNLGMGSSGMSGTILGYPYEVSGALSGTLADNEVTGCLFGNFSYYAIRTVAAVEIFRFMDSSTMAKNTIAIQGFSRRFGRPMVLGDKGAGSANNKTIWTGIPQVRHLKIKA